MRKLIPALLLIWHGPATAAFLATGSTPAVPWLRLVLSLLFCVAMAWAAIALLRRYQRHGSVVRLGDLLGKSALPAPARLKILETRRASQHGDLCLAELDGEVYFLALTSSGVTVLNRAVPVEMLPAGDEA